MAGEVKVTRTSEETTFDDAGKMLPMVRVEFKVGDDGPFIKHFPKEGFSGLSVKSQLEDFARELVTFRNTLQKAAGAANDGWKVLEGALSESGTPRGQKYPF